MKSPLIAVALAATLVAPLAIAGSSTTDEFEMEIEINRTALDDPSAISDEYDRIREQVTDRCVKEHNHYKMLDRYIVVRSCMNQTMDSAIQQINHADLTALHTEQRFG